MKCFTPRFNPGSFLLWAYVLLCLPLSIRCQEPTVPSERFDTNEPRPRAQPSPGLTADQQLHFAEHLMEQQEYFRAITEYRRFLFFHSPDPRTPMVHFRIGLAFYRGQSYAEASQVFSEVATQYADTFYGQQAWLWWGESLVRQRLYVEAEELYAALHQHFPNEPIGQQALYNKGWVLLYRRQWHAASRMFKKISPTSPLFTSAHELAHEALQGVNLAQKSPAVASILSGLLPGSGQLYNGRAGDALLAFFLNGLFIAGILEAIQHNERTVAGVLSFFEAGWYAGNIYGAANGAYKANQKNTKNFLQNLENRYQSLSPELRRTSFIGIKFGFGF